MRLFKCAPGIASACALALAASGVARADEPPCQARAYVHVAASVVDFDGRAAPQQRGAGGRLALGRQNCKALDGDSRWELDLRWNTVTAEDPASDREQAGVMLQRLRLGAVAPWRPYWMSGVGAVREPGPDGRAWYPALELGVGLWRALSARGLALRMDASVQAVHNDDGPGGDRLHHDGRVSLGLVLPLGRD